MENLFAWSITFKWNVLVKKSDDFNFVKNLTKNGDSNVFFYWNTNLNTSQELLIYLKWYVSNDIISSDLSISTEDKIEIFDFDEIDWEYSFMTVSWIWNDFFDVLESFEENEEVVCVREAEMSNIFQEKNIRIDIIS